MFSQLLTYGRLVNMAQTTTIKLTRNVWTLLTNSNVTSLTFNNEGDSSVLVAGTIGAVVPTSDDGAITYEAGEGEANRSITELFPGIAATRIYVKSIGRTGDMFVSHA